MTTIFIEAESLTRFVTWLAWILVHTLWQGAIAALLLWLVLRVVGEARSGIRYGLACAALLAMVLAPAVTGLMLQRQLRADPTSLAASAPPMINEDQRPAGKNKAASNPENPSDAERMSGERERHQPSQDASLPIAASTIRFHWNTWFRSAQRLVDRIAGFLVAAWLFGVLVSAARLAASLHAVRILRRSATPMSDSVLLQTFAVLLQRVGLNPQICLLRSEAVRVPTVLGWLRPVVLFPLSLSSGLSIDQIEALLAHELAHIKRQDYLVHLLQSFVESVLFYHPAVWWISNVIRNEREHCCDTIALRLVADRQVYAKSLFELARSATSPANLAMTASGGRLQERIRRILNAPPSASATSGPAIVLTSAFVLTLLIVATCLPKAGADDPKNTKPSAAETNASTLETKPANDTATEPVEKSAPIATQRKRSLHGGGFGGGEIFNLLAVGGVQQELGLSDEAITKVKEVVGLYRKELQATSPTRAYRVRTTFRDERGMVIQNQEATHEGMIASKAALAKFRPQLREILTPEQFARVQQITWNDMGPAALADDEMIKALEMTKEQQDKFTAINDEYFLKRQQIFDQIGGVRGFLSPVQVKALENEVDTKIVETLPEDVQERFTTLKGKSFDLNLLRNRGRKYINGGGQRSALLALIEHQAVQKELGFTPENSDKLKTLLESLPRNDRADRRPGFREVSGEVDKAEEEENKKIQQINKAATEKLLPMLKETLTDDQFTRLQQIYWQDEGTDAFSDKEMIRMLPVSEELQAAIKVIRKELDNQQEKRAADELANRKKVIDQEIEQEEKIFGVLSKAQLDQFAVLTSGKEFDLRKARFEQSQSENQRLRESRQTNNRGAGREQRRPFLSLVENDAVKKDLGVNEDVAARLKAFSEDMRAAAQKALGDPFDITKMSPAEREQARQLILTTDEQITAEFLPKLKEVLTAEQFTRLKQIHWHVQGPRALQDRELADAIGLSGEQQGQLRELFENARIPNTERVFVRVNVSSLFYETTSEITNINERQAATLRIRETFNQLPAKINEILTKEQQEKLAAIKGKEFDVRLLRQ